MHRHTDKVSQLAKPMRERHRIFDKAYCNGLFLLLGIYTHDMDACVNDKRRMNLSVSDLLKQSFASDILQVHKLRK